MNIFFVSNGTYEYDGRLRELIKISKTIGNTTYITRVNSLKNKQERNHIALGKCGIINYIKFILKSVMLSFNIKNIDILFIDNRKAVIPGLIIKLFKKPRIVIQDVRELYLINEVNHLSGKLGCLFEKTLIKKAEILICANVYRSKIMYEYYSLNERPLVYENIRNLEFTNTVSVLDLEEKFKIHFKNDTFKIISTSGIDVNRTNDKLVSAMKDLGDKYELFLVGGGSKKDQEVITEIIQKKGITNVHLIDKLDINQLKYFIGKCQVGVVNYSKNDANNRYCASGKIYEFIFEGLPVITTENIPLVEIVQKNSLGVSDDHYYNGIIKIFENYKFYQKNVGEFARDLNVDLNNHQVAEAIKANLKNYF